MCVFLVNLIGAYIKGNGMKRLYKIMNCLIALGAVFVYSNSAWADLPVEQAIVTDAPAVPPVITRTTPAKVIVELEVRELSGIG